MTDPDRIKRETIQLPYGKEIRIEEHRFESGMRLLRATIREGSRFTTLDLDPRAAELWGRALIDWRAKLRLEVAAISSAGVPDARTLHARDLARLPGIAVRE